MTGGRVEGAVRGVEDESWPVSARCAPLCTLLLWCEDAHRSPLRARRGPRKGTRARWCAIALQDSAPPPARHAHATRRRHAGLLWTPSVGGSWGCTSATNGCIAVVAPGGLHMPTTQAVLRSGRQARSHKKAPSAIATHTSPTAVSEPARSTTTVAGIGGELVRSPRSPHDARTRATPQPALRSAPSLPVPPLRASAGGPHPRRSLTRPPLSTNTTGYVGCTTPLPADRDATRATPHADPPHRETTKRSRYRPRARSKGRRAHTQSADLTGAAAPPAERRKEASARAGDENVKKAVALQSWRCAARATLRVAQHAASRPLGVAVQPARTHGSGRAAPAAWPVPVRAGRWGKALNCRWARPLDRRGRHDTRQNSGCGHSRSGRLGGARGARAATGARERHSSAALPCIQWREHTRRLRTRGMHLPDGKRRGRGQGQCHE